MRDETREKKRDETRGEERATVRVVHRVARNRAQLLERENETGFFFRFYLFSFDEFENKL